MRLWNLFSVNLLPVNFNFNLNISQTNWTTIPHSFLAWLMPTFVYNTCILHPLCHQVLYILLPYYPQLSVLNLEDWAWYTMADSCCKSCKRRAYFPELNWILPWQLKKLHFRLFSNSLSTPCESIFLSLQMLWAISISYLHKHWH